MSRAHNHPFLTATFHSFERQVITSEGTSVYAADLDGDGDLDVLSASDWNPAEIAWFENSDGRGSFDSKQLIAAPATRTWSIYAADVDDDRDVDVLAASWSENKIAWFDNTEGRGSLSSVSSARSSLGSV